MRVFLYDPGNYTPYYNEDLADALAGLGAEVSIVGSAPLFETRTGFRNPQVRREWLFFSGLEWRALRPLRKRRRLRQIYKALAYPWGVWRSWWKLRREPAAVLHVQWTLLPALDLWLCRALARRGWRVVITLHDVPRKPPRGARRRLLMLARSVIVHTDQLRRQLIELLPVLGGKTEVIPHGAHPIPPSSDESRRQARLRLGWPDDRHILLFFGMLKPYKGVDNLVEAMPRVVAACPNVRLVIAGEPLMDMRPLRQRLRELALDRTVELRLGFIPSTALGDYLAAADLLVAPYRQISMSGVVLQAMSHGCPVLATAVGGFRELLRHGETGFLVEPDGVDPLAEGLAGALQDTSRLRAVGRAGREWLGQNHSWPAVAARTLELYRGLG